MGRKVDWEGAPEPREGSSLPTGTYAFEIEALDELMSAGRDGKLPKLMYKATLRVTEPPAQAGIPHYEHFVIGTDDDPDAKNGDTWHESPGFGRLKDLLVKSGVGLSDDIDDTCRNAAGHRVGGRVVQTVEPATKTVTQNGVSVEVPNQWANRPRSRVTGWQALVSAPSASRPPVPAGRPPMPPPPPRR